MSLKVRYGPVAGALATLLAIAPAWSAEPVVTVYKTPNCGCCVKWIEHLREAGLTVEAKDAGNLDAVRRQLGVPRPGWPAATPPPWAATWSRGTCPRARC